MTTKKKALVLPVAVMAVGIGWLLTSLGIVPEVDWIWTLGLAVIGFLAFIVWGVDRFTVVFGPFFIIASLLSIFRQTGRLNMKTELPTLLIVLGVLHLFAVLRGFPAPAWLPDLPQPEDKASRDDDTSQPKS